MMPIAISLVTANQLPCCLAAADDYARPEYASTARTDHPQQRTRVNLHGLLELNEANVSRGAETAVCGPMPYNDGGPSGRGLNACEDVRGATTSHQKPPKPKWTRCVTS